MKESNLNTDINRSFNSFKNCWCHKIADGIGGISIQNPFDHFGVIKGIPFYSESKLLKSIEAFNFKRIEDHQRNNLDTLNKITINSFCLYFIGIFIPYKFYGVFILDSQLISLLEYLNKKSILKKEFEVLIEKDMYILFKKYEDKKYYLDKEKISNFEKYIIDGKVWKSIFY